MNVKKGVITAAAHGMRSYPVADPVQKAMLPLVDTDGLAKPVIQIIAEEAFSAGIEEICIICAPGDEERYLHDFHALLKNLKKSYPGTDWAEREVEGISNLLERLSFQVQEKALGFGDAVLCARDFVGDHPFLLMLGDHLYQSHLPGKRCAEQLLSLDLSRGESVSAVNPTPAHLISKFGTLAGKPTGKIDGLYEVVKIMEKPSLSLAELELMTPGLRLGYFLCVFGMHVLQAGIFDILKEQKAQLKTPELQLTPALQELAERRMLMAMELKGQRFDLSSRLGMFQAQLGFGLSGEMKDEVIQSVVQLFGEANRIG